jgi:hypothetical protein
MAHTFYAIDLIHTDENCPPHNIHKTAQLLYWTDKWDAEWRIIPVGP